MTVAQFEALRIGRTDGGQNTTLTERNLWNAIRLMTVFIGEVKILKVNTAYIASNFDVTGLGIAGTQCEGWAICNGNNGTTDDGGLTYIGYDSVDYQILGETGGSKDAVVVAHTHEIGTSPNDNIGYITAKSSSSTGGTPITTTSAGVSGLGKNMQPYRVVLKIQRIA